MIQLNTPNGLRVEVPETKIEDTTHRFNINENIKTRKRYRESFFTCNNLFKI